MLMENFHVDEIIKAALKEDMPAGDLTTESIIPKNAVSKALIIAKEQGVLAGLNVAARVFELLEGDVEFQANTSDGCTIAANEVVAELSGCTRTILKGERTALNFLQRLSGIATETHKFCRKVSGTGARIADTRKTTPGLRHLEKYAVRMGGGVNHRFSLSDAVLIKDNHIAACGGIIPAVRAAREKAPHTVTIEVEAETLEQVREAIDAGADIIMLDNMDINTMKEAVNLVGGKALVEASGGISLDNVYEIAKTGVDIISVGSITHSSGSLDFSMKLR
jgi:nicotinate-nucleotide pyrophosphorylase (carboxylating)